MTIKAEIQSLAPSALMEFFTLDASNLENGEVLHFHAGTNGIMNSVAWQDVIYTPLPVQAEGFDITAKGALPRPKLSVANAGGLLSTEIRNFNDFVGCKLIRKRTFVKYLDASNFPDGNPNADPNQYLPDEVWFVERKILETRYVIEFELSSAFDLMGVKLPNRQIIQNSCPWVYRGQECGWNGGYFDKNNQPCGPQSDMCAKTLAACKVRFTNGQPVRFGGFPGAVRGTTG